MGVVSSFLSTLLDTIINGTTSFGVYAHSVVKGETATTRGTQDHLFPLPVALDWSIDWPLDCPSCLRPKVSDLVNLTVAGLNFLDANCRACSCASTVSGLHKSVLTRLATKWWNVARHLGRNGVEVRHYRGAFADLIGNDQSSASSCLVAHKVDLLTKCGQLKLDGFVPSSFSAMINTPASLFKG